MKTLRDSVIELRDAYLKASQAKADEFNRRGCMGADSENLMAWRMADHDRKIFAEVVGRVNAILDEFDVPATKSGQPLPSWLKWDSSMPKSYCSCGHNGDGENSDHQDGFSAGHGACKVDGCTCRQFTWKEFTPLFSKTRNS